MNTDSPTPPISGKTDIDLSAVDTSNASTNTVPPIKLSKAMIQALLYPRKVRGKNRGAVAGAFGGRKGGKSHMGGVVRQNRVTKPVVGS